MKELAFGNSPSSAPARKDFFLSEKSKKYWKDIQILHYIDAICFAIKLVSLLLEQGSVLCSWPLEEFLVGLMLVTFNCYAQVCLPEHCQHCQYCSFSCWPKQTKYHRTFKTGKKKKRKCFLGKGHSAADL